MSNPEEELQVEPEIVVAEAASSSGSHEERVEVVISSPEDQAENETRITRLKLYRAALDGDWGETKDIYDKHEVMMTDRLSKEGDTALHIAVSEKRIEFVKNLVKRMNPEDLATKNNFGNTAFFVAAASGIRKLAEAIMAKNKDVAMIPGREQMLPINIAALHGHVDMVKYLFKNIREYSSDENRMESLVSLIKSCLYDFSLNLLNEHPELATAPDRNGETALHALARKPMTCYAYENQQFKLFNKFLYSNISWNKKMPSQALELVEVLWKQVILLDDSVIIDIIGKPPNLRFEAAEQGNSRPPNIIFEDAEQGNSKPPNLIFEAAKQGNSEFLDILFSEYPDLILERYGNNYNIFHWAVLNRQNDIFNLIRRKRNSLNDSIVAFEDDHQNNILHLAGMLAPPHLRNIVSGAAFQLQKEFSWFEEVRKVLPPDIAEAKNKEGKTPRVVFNENYEELKKMGEQQIKESAKVCMVVATLIATVAFAAALTVPGGLIDETGSPHFLKDVIFSIFIISDAISLILSSYSILTLLSIFTSRSTVEDFLWLLPSKLTVGFATLFSAMVALIIMFCSTIFFLVFKDGGQWLPIFVVAAAPLPFISFSRQEIRFIIIDVFQSSYIGHSIKWARARLKI